MWVFIEGRAATGKTRLLRYLGTLGWDVVDEIPTVFADEVQEHLIPSSSFEQIVSNECWFLELEAERFRNVLMRGYTNCISDRSFISTLAFSYAFEIVQGARGLYGRLLNVATDMLRCGALPVPSVYVIVTTSSGVRKQRHLARMERRSVTPQLREYAELHRRHQFETAIRRYFSCLPGRLHGLVACHVASGETALSTTSTYIAAFLQAYQTLPSANFHKSIQNVLGHPECWVRWKGDKA